MEYSTGIPEHNAYHLMEPENNMIGIMTAKAGNTSPASLSESPPHDPKSAKWVKFHGILILGSRFQYADLNEIKLRTMVFRTVVMLHAGIHTFLWVVLSSASVSRAVLGTHRDGEHRNVANGNENFGWKATTSHPACAIVVAHPDAPL